MPLYRSTLSHFLVLSPDCDFGRGFEAGSGAERANEREKDAPNERRLERFSAMQ